jgi:putative methionine-R-sulfoxide reductase with GAF domain
MTTFAAADEILVREVLMGLLGFVVVSGGGLIIGIFLGAVSSLVTRFTVGVRGRISLY